jgi:hypothetical protein
LYQFISNPETLEKKATLSVFKKPKPVYLLVSAGLLLFLLINIMSPGLFNSYISAVEQNQFNSLRNQPNVASQLDAIISALVEFRIGVFRTDLWRAVLFVVLITGIIYLFSKKKIKQNILILSVVVLSIIDFWGVGRRYVSLDHFSKKSLVKEAYQLTDADHQIYRMQLNSVPGLEDRLKETLDKFNPQNEEEEQRLTTYVINKYSHYRVFNTTQSPFQENVTTNAHRSVGGYHAVKLRRYQDLIEHHISQMNRGVLNMLNTKYLITQNGLQVNNEAMGVAWFVDSVRWADNANDEITFLNDFDVESMAIVRSEDKARLPEFSYLDTSETASIVLEEYEPDRMVYSVTAPEDKLVVFSEVYYPDWKVTIDGKPGELFRANYVLRAMVVPKGEHKIEFVFHPEHFYTSNAISQIAFILLIAALILAVGWSLFQERKKLTLAKN